MAKLSLLSLLLLAWLLAAGSALAWNKAGHMTTGAIAYRELKAADSFACRAISGLVMPVRAAFDDDVNRAVRRKFLQA